ncbi:MAG: PQQ-binding-like beta-propeller repeat protein [Flavobacteriaceae bacterium]
MFKKASEIHNISKGYYIAESMLVYQSGREVFQYDLASGKEMLRSSVEDDFQSLIKKEDLTIGISNTGYAFFDSRFLTKKAISIENGIGDYGLYNSNLIVVTTDYDYSLFLPKQGVQDVFLDKVIWETNAGETIKVESNMAFTVSLKGISRRDIVQGEVKWSLEMNNGNLLPELIGVSNGLVIFAFQENSKLIALDIETGAIKWEIKTLTKGLCIDKKKGLLNQMMVNYTAYDLLTGELKVNYQDSSYFESICIESQRSNYVLYGDYLITTDWKNGVVGAFNTLTHKFDWVHEEEGVSFPSPVPLSYTSPYLLIHDNKGTLHIFERE